MKYIVTGTTYKGARFRLHTSNAVHALGINLWRGSVWQVVDGKRQCIKRVFN